MEIPLTWILIGMCIGLIIGFIMCIFFMAMITPPNKEDKNENF